MDLKERYLLNCYKKLIENNNFTEIDIYGFLILMRNYIYEADLPYIKEFADLIAHRQRTKGIIKKDIKNAIDTKYKITVSNGKNTVIGYNGIINTKWDNEWKKLGKDNNIKISNRTLREITLCIYSLAQKTKYYEEDSKKKSKLGKQIGKLKFFADKESNAIALITTENNRHSFHICFAKYEGYKINESYELEDFVSKCVSYTVRKNGILKLMTSKKEIVEGII